MSIRERNRQLTRRRLADAAATLFLSRGYEATTVEDIAREAGVSRRTFFRYFPSKEEVFFADSRDRLVRFEALVGERAAVEGAWEAVQAALLEVCAGLTQDAARALSMQRVVQASDALTAWELRHDLNWERSMQRVFEVGGDVVFHAALRAGAVMGALRAVLREWFAGGAMSDLVTLVRVALGWLEAALSGDPSERALRDARGAATTTRALASAG